MKKVTFQHRTLLKVVLKGQGGVFPASIVSTGKGKTKKKEGQRTPSLEASLGVNWGYQSGPAHRLQPSLQWGG